MIWLTIGIITSALGGFLLTRYIAKEKHSKHLVCPLEGSCHELTTGRFSRFFGIPVEALGSLYFGLIIIIYLASLSQSLPDVVLLIGLLMSGIGFAFSMYLTIIQIFVVKKWCTLCLGSAAISFMIVVLSFLGYEYAFIEFAYTHRDLLKWLFMLGVIGGTILTTMHARSFIFFLKDFVISRKEERRLEMFSHSAWVAIGLTFLTGLGLVLTDRWREYTDSTAFIVTIVIIGVLIVYEVILNMVISPKLVGLHFGEEHDLALDHHKHSWYRKVAFAMVGVGVVSWYSLLLLSTFNWFSYSSGVLFIGYIALVVLAVIVTMMIEVMIFRKSQRIHYEAPSDDSQE